MKKYHLLTSLLMSLLVTACSTRYSLSEPELNHYLAQKTAFKQELGIKGLLHTAISVQALSVKLGRTTPDTVTLNGTGSLVLSQGQAQQEYSLSLSFNALPYLEPGTGAIFARKLELTQLSISSPSVQQALDAISPLLVSALRQYLAQQPIYQLQENNLLSRLAKSKGQALKVRPGEIQLLL